MIEGLYILSLGVPYERFGPAGRRFVAELTNRIGRSPELFAVSTAAAAGVLLDAISRSDGTRASVTQALFGTRLPSGILGPTVFTSTGDVERSTVTMTQIRRGRAVVADVVEPPPELFAG